jgi:hypothetical protein
VATSPRPLRPGAARLIHSLSYRAAEPAAYPQELWPALDSRAVLLRHHRTFAGNSPTTPRPLHEGGWLGRRPEAVSSRRHGEASFVTRGHVPQPGRACRRVPEQGQPSRGREPALRAASGRPPARQRHDGHRGTGLTLTPGDPVLSTGDGCIIKAHEGPGREQQRTIEIVSYDPSWPRLFQELGGTLRTALGNAAIRIDHGSTAVPGLAAKPILDVQASVPSFEPLEAFKQPLERLGYV